MFEYSLECNTDMLVVVRIRKHGQIAILRGTLELHL
jgi:hypothetical protein